MEPLSALAAASAAFGTLKKGFAIGRDLESMAGDLSRWMGALSDIEWDELIRMEGQIRKKRQETLYRQRERRQKFVEVVAWIIMLSVGVGALILFAVVLKESQK